MKIAERMIFRTTNQHNITFKTYVTIISENKEEYAIHIRKRFLVPSSEVVPNSKALKTFKNHTLYEEFIGLRYPTLMFIAELFREKVESFR
jgi:hypothetical protein